MKKKIFLLAIAALAVMFFAAQAMATCGGAGDAKIYMSQSATWSQGPVKSVASEAGMVRSQKTVLEINGTGFGAVNCVPCAGVMGVGQVGLTVAKTKSSTLSCYKIKQASYALVGDVKMTQLAGTAATAGSMAITGAGGIQTQNLRLNSTVHVPGGTASHSYTGCQTQVIGGGAI